MSICSFLSAVEGDPFIGQSYYIKNPLLDQRVYNMPSSYHVAGIWSEEEGAFANISRDIRVYLKSGKSQFVHYYYGCYDPLQYPLLFPYGDPGWVEGIQKLPHAEEASTNVVPSYWQRPHSSHINGDDDPPDGESLLLRESRNLR